MLTLPARPLSAGLDRYFTARAWGREQQGYFYQNHKVRHFMHIKNVTMKTTESKKPTATTKKDAPAATSASPKKVTPSKPAADEEAVRRKALEIYNERMSRGESGTAEEDWDRAQKALKKSKK